MLVFGQPKTCSEYIQATSRVGRDHHRPGLVVTVFNLNRPRDRSHYERFAVFHETFYRTVEATSVTPFSPRALDRGLAGTLVALARHGCAPLTPPLGAQEILRQRPQLDFVVDAIARRAQSHAELEPERAEELRAQVRQQCLDLDAVRAARNKRPDEIIELVSTGPEAPGITNRDTVVVVRELFAKAEESVLVAGYAVYQGDEVFRALAERMQTIESLDVKFFLNIQRPDNDTSEVSILVRKFMKRLREHQWPEGCRLPEVYCDPRSLALDRRSSLHAKCVVVDREVIFVSPANFTHAGQQRNIEVGLLVRSPIIAGQLSLHFAKLVDAGLMARA